MSARAQLTPFALIVLLTNFGSQLLQTIAALLGHRLLECIDIQPLTVALFKLTFLLRRQSLLLIGQQLKPTIQKTEFEFENQALRASRQSRSRSCSTLSPWCFSHSATNGCNNNC